MKMKVIRLTFWMAVFTLLSFGGLAQPAISPALQVLIEAEGQRDFISVNISLADHYDQDDLYSMSRRIPEPARRRQLVIEELTSFSKSSQSDLMAYLLEQEARGLVRNIKPLWIANVVNCDIAPELVSELILRNDLSRISYNEPRPLLILHDSSDGIAADMSLIKRGAGLSWNVSMINAHHVWEMGFAGEDVVVAVFDTGINYNHHDIADNMWQHPAFPYHGYNFINDTCETMDHNGHGTHCAGTVAGTGASGVGTGVAPGATIMNLQVLDHEGFGTEFAIWEAIQFAVQHGAHVMSLSLGYQHQWNPDRSLWRQTMNNALNVGLIAAVASGNEGNPWGGQPPPNEVRTPGCLPPPWLHPDQTLEGGISAVVSVGATDNANQLAGFSSKGPVTWQHVVPFNDYPYNPGIGLIRPDVVAPGVDVPSLAHSSNTGYVIMSGTSMATPAVAGLMALMLSKNPGLTPEEISQLLEENTITANSPKNNSMGSGRIDALATILATPYMGIRYVDHVINDDLGNGDGKMNPGETIALDVRFLNPSESVIENAVVKLASQSQYISIVDSAAAIGSIAAGDTIAFDNIFSFEVADNIPGNYKAEFVIEAYSENNPGIRWFSGFEEVAFAPYLLFTDFAVQTEDGEDLNYLEPSTIANAVINLTNTGQLSSEAVAVSLQSGNGWLTVLDYEVQNFDPLSPGDSIEVRFAVHAHHSIMPETLINVIFSVASGPYHVQQTEYIQVGQADYYTEGDIPSTFAPHSQINPQSNALEPGLHVVTIPANAIITSVDVQYNMISHNGARKNEQRSFIRCISPGGITEPSVYSGSGNAPGTMSYSRSGLNIANNVTGGGEIEFELHAFRVYGGSGSNTDFIYVPDSTWKVIVHYRLPGLETVFSITNQLGEVVAGAEVTAGIFSQLSDETGHAYFMLPEGEIYAGFYEEKHLPLYAQAFIISDEDNIFEVMLHRVFFSAEFNIYNTEGQHVENAVITFNNLVYEPGAYLFEGLQNGTYTYTVEADGYLNASGEIEILDQDVVVDVNLVPDDTYVTNPDQNGINIYPNPATNRVYIDFGSMQDEKTSLKLMNLNGEVIVSKPAILTQGNTLELPLPAGLQNGVYLLVIGGERTTRHLKLVISK